MVRKFSPSLIKAAVKLYQQLHSGNAVAKRLEVSHSTAYRLLNAGGVALPDRHGPEVQQLKRKLHGKKLEAAAADYQRGMSKADMCAKYGVGWWAIKTAVRESGVQERPKGGRFKKLSDSDKMEAVRLYRDEKLSQVQVAAAMGCSQIAVSRSLRAAGLEIRGGRPSLHGHSQYNGGRSMMHGYCVVMLAQDDPLRCMAHQDGYVLEHRLVMARALRRPLSQNETVHHIDGDKTNNKLSNLQLRFGKHGKGTVLRCRKCGCTDIEAKEL